MQRLFPSETAFCCFCLLTGFYTKEIPLWSPFAKGDKSSACHPFVILRSANALHLQVPVSCFIACPLSPFFSKGGQVLGMSPFCDFKIGQRFASVSARFLFFHPSAVPLFFQKGDYRGIPLFEKLNDLCHMHVPFPFFVIFRLARHV
mgnify:CR=1 FL=1